MPRSHAATATTPGYVRTAVAAGQRFRTAPLRRPVRLGVVGAGSISSHYHLPSIAALAKSRPDLVEFAALCEPNVERAAAARRFHPGALFGDLATLLKTAPLDCVEVIVPVPATKAVAIQCLRAGFPVLMEKPAGASVAEARAIAAAARRAKLPAMVAFNRRWTPLLNEAKAAVAGEKLLHVGVQFFRSRRDEDDFYSGTGIHGLDALRFLAGDVKSVYFERAAQGRGLKPTCQAQLEFASGARGEFTCYPQSGCNVERYTLVTEHTTVFVQLPVGWLVDKPGLIQVFRENKLERQARGEPHGSSAVDLAQGGGFYFEIEAFLEGIQAGRFVSPQVPEVIQSQALGLLLQNGRNGTTRLKP
ncbi:MAG: Gfo/Idh/MocA family oxidoreductase [Planctomycetota bacterium]